jgi:hypothetical protein
MTTITGLLGSPRQALTRSLWLRVVSLALPPSWKTHPPYPPSHHRKKGARPRGPVRAALFGQHCVLRLTEVQPMVSRPKDVGFR